MLRTLRSLAVMAVLALVASVDFVRDTAIAAYTAAKRTVAFVFDLGMSLVATEPQIASLRAHLQQEREAVARVDVPGRTRLLADFHMVLARMLGNEVLDAMPVQLIARHGGAQGGVWHERGVVLDAQGQFAWQDRPTGLRPPLAIDGTVSRAATRTTAAATAIDATATRQPHTALTAAVSGLPTTSARPVPT